MKAKIGYFSPMPPAKSGIARYSECLLPYLAQLMDVTLFTTEPDVDYSAWENRVRIEPADTLSDSWWRYDALIYNMGNSFYHEQIYRYASLYSGIVVLHDHGLHHFMRAQANTHPYQYIREAGYEDGREGIRKAWRVLANWETPDYFSSPLNRRLLDMQFGVIVHSDYTQKLVAESVPALKTAVIPLLDTVDTSDITPISKLELGIPDDSILVAIGGQVTANKQVDFLLEVFAKVRSSVPNLYFVVIGEPSGKINLDDILEKHGVTDCVIRTNFVADDLTFFRWLCTADVIVNLRYPTLGETSSVVLQALSLARPTIVFDHGWYAELDDDACIKVPVMDQPALFNALSELVLDSQLREKIGQAGQVMIKHKHHPEKIAQAYTEFVANL